MHEKYSLNDSFANDTNNYFKFVLIFKLEFLTNGILNTKF